MPVARNSAALLRSGFIPGILGGLLAFALSNIWFYFFGAAAVPGFPGRNLMPDFCAFLQIDAYVGAGCGYAAGITAPALAGLFDASERQRRLVLPLYALFLGAGISIIANSLLLLMSFL